MNFRIGLGANVLKDIQHVGVRAIEVGRRLTVWIIRRVTGRVTGRDVTIKLATSRSTVSQRAPFT